GQRGPAGDHPRPAVRAAAQAARPRRRRDHPHPQGAPERHRRALRRHHRGAARGPGGRDDHQPDHLPGRHDRGPGADAEDLRPDHLRDPEGPGSPARLEWSPMSTFLNLLVYGLADGAILALAALGFVLIYKATGVINFAQGEFLLVGAYMFYTAFVVLRLPMVLAVVFGVVVATLIGIVIERLILRPMVGESPISIIMVTIGLSMLLRALVQMFYGTSPMSQPPLLPRTSISF